MIRSFLDTDMLSEVNKAVDAGLVQVASNYLVEHGSFTMSSITVMEVVRGYRLANRLDRLEVFLTTLSAHEVLPFTRSTAELAGKIDADLIRTGQPIGRADPMIAATAIEHSLQLDTGNISHFMRIRDLGYSLELTNWRSA